MSDITAVCSTSKIFCYDDSPPKCRATALNVTPATGFMLTSNIAAVGPTFLVFSYDAVWDLFNAERMRYMLRAQVQKLHTWTLNLLPLIVKATNKTTHPNLKKKLPPLWTNKQTE